MPKISVEVEIYCSCGVELCRQSKSGNTRGKGTPYITVHPCEKCLEASRDVQARISYDEGYADKEKETVKEEGK